MSFPLTKCPKYASPWTPVSRGRKIRRHRPVHEVIVIPSVASGYVHQLWPREVDVPFRKGVGVTEEGLVVN